MRFFFYRDKGKIIEKQEKKEKGKDRMEKNKQRKEKRREVLTKKKKRKRKTPRIRNPNVSGNWL